MKLSKIKYHELRDYWKNEAHDFTKWISESENLELLSKTLGIQLEFIKREASKNSRLRVDILARNKENDEIVIIENQLEETDYSHLGKLVTYASIFESNTIIWIVKNIRPEHELAVNWLNNNSKDPINIFLVRVELISIDDSELAPLFTVLSKPYNHNLPKVKSDFVKETIEIIDEKTKLEKAIFDIQIIDFFDKFIELGKLYTKRNIDKNATGLLEILQDFNKTLYLKYSIKFSREFKRDLILWANYRGYKFNQEYFERTGKRNFKKGGKEYFVITE